MIGCNSCTEDIAIIPGFGGGFVHIREGEGEEGKKRKGGRDSSSEIPCLTWVLIGFSNVDGEFSSTN
jgi:hypothetical protein